jgi:hypothetical protein
MQESWHETKAGIQQIWKLQTIKADGDKTPTGI